MSSLTATIEGIGFWANGLPGWDAARAYVRDGRLPADAPARPSPQLLAPNERRRAPDSVAVALEAGLSACIAAQRDPATLASVFASTHGDLAITDYMCSTLAADPTQLSPTKFHNSVHNAAAGYWTIGNRCHRASTAISAFDASFAQGLLEALLQLDAGEPAVLLVGFDTASAGPLSVVSRSEGSLAGALLLSHERAPGRPRVRATLVEGSAPAPDGPLGRRAAGNAMAPMLPLFDTLAGTGDVVLLHAGPGRTLRLELAND